MTSWFGDDDKIRKGDWPIWDYMFGYFPKAWLEEVRVAVTGNKQHNPGEKLHWARGKSMDQLNTAFRHLFDYAKAKSEGAIVPRDARGMAVLAQSIWRLKAQLELDLEEEIGRQNCIPVPSSIKPDQHVQRHCKCGAKTFNYNKGDIPPSVVDPATGLKHSEVLCV